MPELANNWYATLSTLNAAAAGPLRDLSDGLGLPLVSALLFGLIGATSPCQVTTNLSALAFISPRLHTTRAPVLAALAYLLGKTLVYTVLGVAVVLAGRELATNAIPLIVVIRKVLGPFMILLGLFFIGVVCLNVSIGHDLSAWLEERAAGGGLRGSFLLGVAFAFAFCPTLFWLFFGLTIPLALRSPLGVLYPPTFALGTTLPLLGLIGLLVIGVGQTKGYLQALRRANRVLERVAGVVLILAGLNDTFVYWFL